MLLGFLNDEKTVFWTYAVAADILIQGSDFIRFSSKDVNFSNRTINAEVWVDGEWVKKRSRFPDAIRNFELRNYNKRTGDHILGIIPYSLGPTVSKFEQTELFNRIPSLASFVPETLEVNNKIDIIEKIKEWGAGLLKPMRGRLGQGIIFIKTDGSKFNIEENTILKTITRKQLRKQLKPFYKDDARPYILQQFAAGTAPNGRFYNIRIVVVKSGDGDWHPCNIPMSLLALRGSIIANREVGSKNIDLISLLKKKFGSKSDEILDKLFEASVKITRVLDDSVNGTAEEIALDLAIDDRGHVWIHEANWRGGIWLFEDDIGLHRHGGANLKRIALQNRAGPDIDTSNAVKLVSSAKKHYVKKHFLKKPKSTNVTLGIKINRRSYETISLVSQAVINYLPILAISSQTSFRLAQKAVGDAFNVLREQLPLVQLPKIISLGGACVHNPEKDYKSHKWLVENFVETDLITMRDLENGFSLSPNFLRQIIKDNRKDLGVDSIDIFIIEGLERSLKHQIDYEKTWIAAAKEISVAIDDGLIKEWGFALDESTLLDNNKYTAQKLLNILQNSEVVLPSTLFINIKSNDIVNIEKLMSILDSLPLKLVFSLPDRPLKKKNWNEPHRCVSLPLIKKYIEEVFAQSIILAPVATSNDVEEILNINFSQSKVETLWYFLNDKQRRKFMPISKQNNKILTTKEKERAKRSVQALYKMAHFDSRQYFRFFVDGRFHKSYRGWVGYEENEPGSAIGILNAYSYILDNFDLCEGLKPSYVRKLHFLCMNNVMTKNVKSTPGELRFLEAGFNIYKKYSTLDSVAEILEIRSGDGTPVFHTAGFEKQAEMLEAKKIIEVLKDKNRLKFRPWYPSLTQQQKKALTQDGDLDRYYEVKHYIQRGFAKRLDGIISYYNEEVAKSKTSDDILIAISRVTRNIEMLHPFPDGNGRLCIAILMNHLLLYHGFLPAILFDPNIDIELSVKEFAQEIKDGIANTQVLLENPEALMYDFSINDLTPKENETFKEMSKDFALKLAPYADLRATQDSKNQYNHSNVYCYLTPDRLANTSDGSWVNVNNHTVSSIRFGYIGITPSKNQSQQLLFINNLKRLMSDELDPISYIDGYSKDGVVAVVLDDIEIAKKLNIPALYVEDVNDALYRAARAVRRAVHVKAIAIAGSDATTLTKTMLYRLLKNQAQVHTKFDGDNKTPDIMSSLINLKLTHNIEIAEIQVGARSNVTRYRSRAISPHICFFSFVDIDKKDVENFENIIDAYSATVEGLNDGGVCLINSDSKYTKELVEAIRKRKDVSIQTFGHSNDDIANVIKATFDKKNQEWKIEANILGELLNYIVSGSDEHIPTISVGVLLAISTLGYDIYEAAEVFKN